MKAVSSWLHHLPPSNFYKVVFMRRNLQEVLASQAKMLARRGEESQTSDEEMIGIYERHLEKVEFQLRFRDNFEALYLHYSDVVADPQTAAEQINEFVGGTLDVEAMVGAVDSKLYRNRAESAPGA